jgi:ABC-type phosphate transport system substrate-binding protein
MPSSIKHAGGLKNSDLYLFGRTGRPLSADEKGRGKREILLGRVPIGFAVGLETGIKSINSDQLRSIFSRKIVNWKQVGGVDAPIFLAGRDPNEAVFSALKDEFPWFKEVTFDQVFAKDDDAQKFIVSPEGRYAIVFGSNTQLPDKQVIKIAGFSVGLRVGLVYDKKNEILPLVEAAKRFSVSKEWNKLLKKNGLMALR